MTVSDVQVVEWATGVLAEWNEAGVLAAADVHITDRLVTMCAEPVSETARLGAALAVRAVRLGSTCLALDRLGELAGDDTAVPMGIVMCSSAVLALACFVVARRSVARNPESEAAFRRP